jgi:repressor LexA
MNTSANLTRRQQTVFDYICELDSLGAPAPTLDELCEALNLRSRGSMHKHVQALIAAGLVEPMAGKQRGVRLLEQPDKNPAQLPLFGYIAAGKPIEAIENPESIEVPPVLRSEKPCYVLKVRGDSMIENGILEGDWVIVEQRDHARNGEIVVALIDGSDATLKRITQRRGQVRLSPANSTMKPMIYSPKRVQIQGVVVGQMRAYR